MSDLSATLAEARDYFLEAEFELAAEKFEEAKAAAVAASDADSKVAADTGLAEVAIQRKDWETAVGLLEAALAVQGAKAPALVRARYMLGLARMAQGRAEEARGEFEAALDEQQGGGGAAASGVRGDIEDRLAQLDELQSLEEDDLLEIAMEFGASAAAEEYGPDDDDEDDEEGEEDDDEDEEEDEEDEVSGVVCADDVDDDDDGEEDEDQNDDDSNGEAAAAFAAALRKRKAAGVSAATEENGSGEKRAKANGESHAEAPSTATCGDGDKKGHE